MSSALFATAPAVVLAGGGNAHTVSHAAKAAKRLTAPVLLAADRDKGGSHRGKKDGAAVAAEVQRLGARWVLPVGDDADHAARSLADAVDGLRVAHHAGDIPRPSHAPKPPDIAALVTTKAPKAMTAGVAAAKASARAADATLIPLSSNDPRADHDVIAALSHDDPDAVVAVGGHFGPAKRLTARVKTAETGVELPGGGQVMFPGRTLVALYGHPGTSSLGVLGAQGLDASIQRAATVAKPYRSLVKGPVIPSFEIIATVATGTKGPSGTYSSESRVATLRPWVKKATKAGMYVILDLQPGRANLLSQAKEYRELLKMPSVGLALDPEWKLGPSQRPLQQIGGVDASEVNSVIDWLGGLVAKHHLPQKLLVLHQFRLSMLRDESAITTTNDDVQVLIHMDGQGTPGMKDNTWHSVVGAAPKGVVFGWKNFYTKDHPTLTPQQTIDHKPTPVMISYQ